MFLPLRRSDHTFLTITGSGGKGGMVINNASSNQERPTDDNMMKFFEVEEDITIGAGTSFKDVPRKYFVHHNYRTPHRNARLIMSEEGDTIFTWIYGNEIYIRTRSGTDLTGYKYDQIKYPTMNGLMPKCNEKKVEQMCIHHLVFVTFADDKAIERFFSGLSVDHINRNIGDSRWVNLRVATTLEQSENKNRRRNEGYTH